MNEERAEQRTSKPQAPELTLVTAETLRAAALASLPAASPKGEERLPLFWRVFGATLLSIAALVVITLCQHFNSSLNDLRADVAHLNENQAHLVQKSEFSSHSTSVWNSIKELNELRATVVALKEKALVREEQLREQEERKELVRELQQLRERLATLEGRHEGAAEARAGSTPMP
jgi:hypothetical protein